MKLDVNERHRLILNLIAERGFVSISKLAGVLRISEQTVRRDLMALAEQGLATRVHGGAGLPVGPGDTGYDSRRRSFAQEKQRIGKAIAERIPDGATLFIDIGTTMEAFAESLLNHRHLTVLTNHLSVATILSRRSEFQVILAGGVLRHNDQATTGEATREFLERFRVSFGVFGIGGVSPEGDLLDYDFRDIGVSTTAMKISKRKFIALDHSKFESTAMARTGSLRDVDAVFTDAPPPEIIRSILQANEVELVIAPE